VSVVTNTIRNGVDTEKMFATLDLIKAQPELAKFQFRATNRWIDGAHNRSTIKGFYAADALKAAGYFAAPVPVELGGLGVSSAHDLVVASSRLARGDASVAIGVNMHLVAVLNMERRRQVAVAAGADRRARGFASSLKQVARDGVVLAAAISEPGQDLTRPGTRATRTKSGWRIDGRKMFCTMSPAATDLYVAVTYADGQDSERYAYAIVPKDAAAS
jgi:L-evernosamine nitrososynthase